MASQALQQISELSLKVVHDETVRTCKPGDGTDAVGDKRGGN
jgi:hypothetical protein